MIDNGVQTLTWASENNDRVTKLDLDNNKRIKSLLSTIKQIVDGKEQENIRSYQIIDPVESSELSVSKAFQSNIFILTILSIEHLNDSNF